jgi:hypothetical protein
MKLEREQLSVAVGAVQVAIALQDALADNVILLGHPVITGLLLSTTTMLNVHVDVLPEPSVAVYVTGVVPIENSDPDVWLLLRLESEQLSVAVGAVQVAAALHDPFADKVMVAGHPVITGLVLSITITLNVQVAVFPEASVAV